MKRIRKPKFEIKYDTSKITSSELKELRKLHKSAVKLFEHRLKNKKSRGLFNKGGLMLIHDTRRDIIASIVVTNILLKNEEDYKNIYKPETSEALNENVQNYLIYIADEVARRKHKRRELARNNKTKNTRRNK